MELIDVAIVGAGVAGSAAACAFSGSDLTVSCFERRDLARDPNRGDALHPASVVHLERLDALADIYGRGAFWLHEMGFFDGDGDQIASLDLRSHPLLMLAHAEIEASLLATAKKRGVRLHLDAVQSIVPTQGGWELRTGDATHQTRLLVAADGWNSFVRRSMEIPVRRTDYREAIIVLHGRQPEWLGADSGAIILNPAGPALCMPTTPKGRARFTVPVSKQGIREWKAATEAELHSHLSDLSSLFANIEVTKAGGSHVYQLIRQRARTYRMPALALIGDAAHVTHPFGGQGMNLAIQDAVELATLAVDPLRTGDQTALDSALTEFERRRRPINNRAIQRAHFAARFGRPGRLWYSVAKGGLRFVSRSPRTLSRLADLLGGR